MAPQLCRASGARNFGPTYAATTSGDTDVGLQADTEDATKAPLPVIEIEDLEAAEAAVEQAGGRIVRHEQVAMSPGYG